VSGHSRLIRAAAIAASGLIVGCSSSGAPGTGAPVAEIPETPEPDPFSYVLKRGDKIEIRVHELPELEAEAIIRPDGKISAVMLDDVVAAGRMPRELAAALAEGWSPHFRDPDVTVVVRSFANHNVYVGGEVEVPGLIPLRSRLSSAKAVFSAGGFKDVAQRTNVILIRNAGGKTQVFSLDLEKVLAGESRDIRLQPYDVIYVPKSKIARVNLFVEQWITQMIPIQLQGVFNYSYVFGSP
jgi:protein involved in polysaccharide export with SLBB domain